MILALWSAPRCRSTAFLRMMAERGDFTVIHEPFSHVTDFGEKQIGDRVAQSEQELIAQLRSLPGPVFFKDTTDFRYPGLLSDKNFLQEATHTFIVRDPRAAIASHYALNPDLSRDEIGFAWLYEIFEAVRDATGTIPVVVDADRLVSDPEGTVREYCRRTGIRFVPEALSWSPQMRPDWRSTAGWHEKTSRTSGFQAAEGTRTVDVLAHPELRTYYEYHLPYYERLLDAAI